MIKFKGIYNIYICCYVSRVSHLNQLLCIVNRVKVMLEESCTDASKWVKIMFSKTETTAV